MPGEAHSRLHLPPVSPAADAPLYRQIVDGIKRELSEGRLQPGTPLPSFRALAEDLLVSLITVKRAYEELEREGIIFRKQGLGTFISENGVARSQEVMRSHVRELLAEAVQEGREAGLSGEELTRMLGTLLEKEDTGHG